MKEVAMKIGRRVSRQGSSKYRSPGAKVLGNEVWEVSRGLTGREYSWVLKGVGSD